MKRKIVKCILYLLLITLLITGLYCTNCDKRTVIAQIKYISEDGHSLIVEDMFTKEKFSLYNNDNFLYLKYNSEKIVNLISYNDIYKIEIVGIELREFQWYPNIISVEIYNIE